MYGIFVRNISSEYLENVGFKKILKVVDIVHLLLIKWKWLPKTSSALIAIIVKHVLSSIVEVSLKKIVLRF